MARSSENIAAAIEAVNGIIAEQNAALKALKDTLSQKAGGGVSLGDIDVYVGDFQTAENYSLISGSIDGYWNILVS